MKWLFGQPPNAPILCRAAFALIALAYSNLAFCDEIHHAAASGDVSKVNALIRANPDLVNAKDTENLFGWTPLIYAVATDHKQVVELLLAHGADVNPKNALHWTPLYTAAQAGNVEVIKVLLAHKADPNVKDDMDGTTPLHRAAESGRKDIAELLLDAGADVNAKMKFRDIEPPLIGEGMTPLHTAVLNSHKDMVELLLAHKADVNAKSYYGDTPLKLATDPWHNKKEIIELLRQHGGKE